MLWYKSWLETKWRFLIGLGLLICSAASVVFVYPQVIKLMPLVPSIDMGGPLGQRIRESVELSREYRGYVWSQWWRQNLMQTWTIFAVLIGTGGLLSPSSGMVFTLSLPVSRDRVVGIRAAVGLLEMFVLALVPSLMIPLVSPGVGESYSVSSALVHGMCLFVAGSVFFSFAFLLSTVFADFWRPLLIALSVAMVLAFWAAISRDLGRYTVFPVMSGEVFFRTGGLPWAGLLASASASAAMLYGASRNVARHDF